MAKANQQPCNHNCGNFDEDVEYDSRLQTGRIINGTQYALQAHNGSGKDDDVDSEGDVMGELRRHHRLGFFPCCHNLMFLQLRRKRDFVPPLPWKTENSLD